MGLTLEVRDRQGGPLFFFFENKEAERAFWTHDQEEHFTAAAVTAAAAADIDAVVSNYRRPSSRPRMRRKGK